jgi:hypothetical protein
MFKKGVFFSHTHSLEITGTQTRAEEYQIYQSPRETAQVLTVQN